MLIDPVVSAMVIRYNRMARVSVFFVLAMSNGVGDLYPSAIASGFVRLPFWVSALKGFSILSAEKQDFGP